MIEEDLKKLVAEIVSEKVSQNDTAHKKEEDKLKDIIAKLENEKKEIEKEKEVAKKRIRSLEEDKIKSKIRRSRELREAQTLRYKKEKEFVDNCTEQEVDLFLKKNEHRMDDYKGGQLTVSVNIYELALIRKLKSIKGEHYTQYIFLLLKQYLERYNEENKEK